MRYQHDPAKAASNFEKHGVSFVDGEGALQDPLALTIEDPKARGERRFVSARRATRKERRDYEA